MPSLQNAKETLDYLGTIGSTDRGDKVELSRTAKALVKLSSIIINEARNNLKKGGHDTSGDLSASMVSKDIVTNGTKMELDIELKSYYKFLDRGVKGTEGGAGEFSFKNNHPSKKMRKSIGEWIRRRGMRSRGYAKKYRPYGQVETKDTSTGSTDPQDSMIWAMATSIKKKGIKPTKFFSNAIAKGRRETKKILGDALRIDIIESIKNN